MSDDSDAGGNFGGGDYGGGGGFGGNDSVTETTTSGFGSNILGGIVAALFGILLVIVSVVLLWWNEGRAVEASRALSQGARQVVEVAADPVDAGAQGKLVHLAGMMTTPLPARDGAFGVGGDNLLRLKRSVAMYQWVEHKESHTEKNFGGSSTTQTTYSYRREWSENAVDSGRFREPNGHRNPPMPVRSTTIDASDVHLGAYRVADDVLDNVSTFTTLEPRGASLPDGYRQDGDILYRGNDQASPAIGDIRVRYTAVRSQTMSVIAMQQNGALTPFHASNGYTIALAESGTVPAAAMFKEKAHEESILTWVLRPVGFLLMDIGLILTAAPITAVLGFIPLLGDIAGIGAALLSLVVAVPLTLFVIAVAWIAHRPLLGGGLIAAALVLGFLLRRLHRPRQQRRQQQPPPPAPPPQQTSFLPPGMLPR